MIVKYMTSIQSLLQDTPIGNSNFQADNFITKKVGGPTLWGQYKQALRELHVRYGNIIEYSFDLKEELLKIKKQELKLENLKNQQTKTKDPILDLDIQILENKINRRKTMVIESRNEFFKGQKEFLRFYAHATILKKKIEEKHGELTEKLKDSLEEEYWTIETYDTIARLTLANTQVNDIIKAVVSKVTHFPTKTQQKILEDIKNRHQIAQDFLNRPKEYVTDEEIEIVKKELPSTQKLLEEVINNRESTQFLIEDLNHGKD